MFIRPLKVTETRTKTSPAPLYKRSLGGCTVYLWRCRTAVGERGISFRCAILYSSALAASRMAKAVSINRSTSCFFFSCKVTRSVFFSSSRLLFVVWRRHAPPLKYTRPVYRVSQKIRELCCDSRREKINCSLLAEYYVACTHRQRFQLPRVVIWMLCCSTRAYFVGFRSKAIMCIAVTYRQFSNYYATNVNLM